MHDVVEVHELFLLVQVATMNCVVVVAAAAVVVVEHELQ